MRRPISLLLLLAGLLAALPAAAHGPTFEVAYSGVRPQQLVIRVGDTVHFRNRNLAAGACTLVTEDGEWIPSLPRGGDHHETFEAPLPEDMRAVLDSLRQHRAVS